MQTIAFKYRVKSVLSDRAVVEREMEASYQLYNDLIAIERRRRARITEFWAERGGYIALLQEQAEARDAARALPAGDERKAAFKRLDEITDRIYAAERETTKAHREAEQSADPALARRKERTAELREAAKARGEKLTPKQISDVLDADPQCLTERDRIRLEAAAEAAERGRKPHPRTIATLQRAAGCVGPTEHIDAEARSAGYAAYQARGVTQGTRGFVADAVKKAIADAAPFAPRFKTRDQGRVSFGVSQVVGGEISRVTGCDHTQVQMSTLPDNGRVQAGSRRSGRRALLRVRIGSEGKRKAPAWADFEIIAHRPLPPDTVVRQVRVTRERVGSGFEWHAVITVQLPDDSPICRPAQQPKAEAVAVDLGFRSRDGSLRTAFFVGTDGAAQEIATPIRRIHKKPDGRRSGEIAAYTLLDTMAHAADQDEMLTRLLGDQTEMLGTWISGLAEGAAPEWFRERTRGVRQWRSEYRMAALFDAWRAQRFDGDEAVFERTLEWHKAWRHNRDWAENEQRGVVRARREHYRTIATDLARRYSVILVSDVDLASTKRRKTAEQTDGLVMVEDAVRSQAQSAAPGELREELVRAAKKHGCFLIKAKSDSTTCNECGATCAYNRAKSIEHTCEHCGATWDQDDNAARNMLHGYTRERSGGVKKPGGARKPATTRSSELEGASPGE